MRRESRLIHDPYTAPSLRRGDRTVCILSALWGLIRFMLIVVSQMCAWVSLELLPQTALLFNLPINSRCLQLAPQIPLLLPQETAPVDDVNLCENRGI
jgi:hypothetical protein